MTLVTCWTCSTVETQPVVRRRGADRADVTLIVGTWTPLERLPVVSATVEIARDGNWAPWAAEPAVAALDRSELQRRRECGSEYDRLQAGRHLVDVAAVLDRRRDHHFFEVAVPDLPYGALIRVAVIASLAEPAASTEPAVAVVRVLAPEFDHQDLRCSHTTREVAGSEQTLPERQWWVLMTQEDDGCAFDHFRLDLLHTDDPRQPDFRRLAPIRLRVDEGPEVDLQVPAGSAGGVSPTSELPARVDRSTDSVLCSVPRTDGQPWRTITISVESESGERDVTVVQREPNDPGWSYRPTALMLIQYCIQGLNDLFAEPVAAYSPPRSYIEIAYRDEDALFCSRPLYWENGVPDGYVYALEAQQAFNVPTMWAFNAGALALLKHGLPGEEFATQLAAQVRSGLISPCNAGFGAHRPPYYASETNVREIQLGLELLRAYFPGSRVSTTYYPDQRIYAALPQEVDAYRALRERGLLSCLVLDRSTVATGAGAEERCRFGGDRPREGNFLWRDTRTGLDVLLIEDELRNRLLNADSQERDRGQLALDLRRLFLQGVRSRAGEPAPLFVYGDDADHACGDGWFDGTNQMLDGSPLFYTRSYLAALCWIRDHPWVRAYTHDGPDFDRQQYGDKTLDVSSAICPSVDPGGVESIDVRRNPIHFDAWYDDWAATRSQWLGTTLREISDRAEEGLLHWPEEYRNSFYRLSWMAFLSGTHESMWSKQPVESDVNGVGGSFEPEDFVVSATLQQRNTWVYLNASVWAEWARGARDDPRTYLLDSDRVDPGPLGPLLRERHSADPYWPNPSADARQEYFFDQDCLSTLVLYNRHVLLVVDRNGGRVTHIFCADENGAISISGTCKAYQFLTPRTDRRPEIACDGQRIQNTVYTPNHRYVAADVEQAQWRLGTFTDPRPPGLKETWYPDNFNAYDCRATPGRDGVTCRYAPGEGASAGPVTEDRFGADWEADGRARRDGSWGTSWQHGAGFIKTIRLHGSRIEISYAGVPPGHLVSNELAVDFESALMLGEVQLTSVAPDLRSVTISSVNGAAATVRLGSGCEFVEPARQSSLPTEASDAETLTRLQQAYGAVHRVMTTDLRIRCTGPASQNAFDYVIEAPKRLHGAGRPRAGYFDGPARKPQSGSAGLDVGSPPLVRRCRAPLPPAPGW